MRKFSGLFLGFCGGLFLGAMLIALFGDLDVEEIKEQAAKELPLYEIPAKPLFKAKSAEYDTGWGLLPRIAHVASVVGGYDIGVVSPAESSVSAKYPNSGTPVDRFVWQFEVQTTGGGLPSDVVEGMRAEIRLWFGSEADSVRVRLKGIDFDDVEGPFSVWSDWLVY